MTLGQPLGSVTQGSLTGGLEVRLHPDILVEDMRVGKFLVVQGVRSRFFCMLTDVALGTANQRIIANPPSWEDTFLREILAGSGTYGTITLAPMLMFTPPLEGGEVGGLGDGEMQNRDWSSDVCSSDLRFKISKFKFLGIISTPNKYNNGVDASQNYS